MMNETQRQEKMRELDGALSSLYFSPRSGDFFYSVYRKHLPGTVDYGQFITYIGDTILGFYHTKDLPTLLQREVGVSADVSQKIMADLIETLTPVLTREREQAEAQVAELRQLKDQFGSGQLGTPVMAPTPSTPTPPAEHELPVTAPEATSVHDVTPMRTMATDMNRVHGYGAYRAENPLPLGDEEEPVTRSTQDAILKERPPLTGVPQLGE